MNRQGRPEPALIPASKEFYLLHGRALRELVEIYHELDRIGCYLIYVKMDLTYPERFPGLKPGHHEYIREKYYRIIHDEAAAMNLAEYRIQSLEFKIRDTDSMTVTTFHGNSLRKYIDHYLHKKCDYPDYRTGGTYETSTTQYLESIPEVAKHIMNRLSRCRPALNSRYQKAIARSFYRIQHSYTEMQNVINEFAIT